jgi:hypothetical protein
MPLAGARATWSPRRPEPEGEAEGEKGVGFEPGAGFELKSGGEEHEISNSNATTTRVRRISVLWEGDRFYRANPDLAVRYTARRRASCPPI